jgi:membrane protein
VGLKVVWKLLKDTFTEWSQDNASRLAAALAYYTVFSIAPLLIIAIAIAGIAAGLVGTAPQEQVISRIRDSMGSGAANLVQTMIKSISVPSNNVLATAVGVAAILLGAAGLFSALQGALNTIWEVMPTPGRSILSVVLDRLISFAMVLGTGFFLLASLAVSAGLAALGKFFVNLVPDFSYVWQVVDFVVSFGIIGLLFAMIYKVLPDVEIAWGDVWIGAAVTSLLFNVGKFLIGLYLGRSSVGSLYGAAGSLAVFLVWIYYSAQIILFGAEFTQVYARQRGSPIVPSRHAMFVSQAARARQGLPPTPQARPPAQNGEEPVVSPAAGGREAVAQPQPDLARYRAAVLGFILGLIVGSVNRKQRSTSKM